MPYKKEISRKKGMDVVPRLLAEEIQKIPRGDA